MQFFYLLIGLVIGAHANALQLRDDSDFEWISGCEISKGDINCELVFEDMVKKQYPDTFDQLVVDKSMKRRLFKELERAKEAGYLCAPVAVLKFDLKMGAYDQYVSGFSLSQEKIPKRISIKNEQFRNLPNVYDFELLEFSIPKIVTIDKNKAYRMLQRCPEIQKESSVLLEVSFVFGRKGAGHYVGVPKGGRISANCELMPNKLMELVSFGYKENK